MEISYVENLKSKVISSYIWKTAQTACTLGMTFIVQIILARMLTPEDFGTVAIASVFMTLANTVIETSFSSSIVQRETIDKETLSSIFYANLFLSIMLYALLFFSAPLIASFYEMEILVLILRIQGIRIIFSALHSIQSALLHRQMRYRQMFFASFGGAVLQGAVGILMAYLGMGVWALVMSTIIGYCFSGLLIMLISGWMPAAYFSFAKVREPLKYSSRVLITRVTDRLFLNIRTLAVGHIYNAEILGYFNKGFQFPSTVMTIVDGSVTSVSFTSLSKLQNDREKFLLTLRQYVQIIMFISLPMLAGMAMAAEPMVILLLTEKWRACIPFLQIICLTHMLIPLNVKTIALESLGNSGLSMIIQLVSMTVSLILMFAASRFSAVIMVLSELISCVIRQIIIAAVSKKYLKYSVRDQIMDAGTALLPTLCMVLAVYFLNKVPAGSFCRLCLDVGGGILVFTAVCAATGNKTFHRLTAVFLDRFPKRKS